MPRKKKTPAAPVEPATTSEPIASPEPEQPGTPSESAPIESVSTALALPETFPSESRRHEPEASDAERPQDTSQPRGPFWFQSQSLSHEPDGPKMRLGRDNRYQQMSIQFDVKPCEEVRQRLQQEGWRWRQQESQWTKQLQFEHRATGQLAAERFFAELAKIEQQEHTVEEKQVRRSSGQMR